MPKIATTSTERRKQKNRSSKNHRHDPLHVDILGMDDDDGGGDELVKENVSMRKKGKEHKRRKKGLDQSLQEKIIRAAVMQQEELEKEESNIDDNSSSDDDDDEIQVDKMDGQEGFGTYDLVGDDDDDDGEEEEEEVLELDESDVQLLDSFFSGGMQQQQQQQQQPRQLDLSAMILEKIREREFLEGKDQQQVTQSEEDIKERIHPKVFEAYRKIGKLLKRYRSGPLPKAFKAVPRLGNWEDILFITKPEKWSPHAVYAATVIFASSNDAICQRFLNLILLPRMMEDLEGNKKLNPHLYQSLMKAMHRPGAFFKGIVLPMCEDSCTTRQATAVCSVIKKMSIPKLHSAAALLKIAQMGYSPSTLLFVKCLIEKHYALPSKVIDTVTDFFYLAMNIEESLPVVWHQALLSFVQIYKLSFAKDHKKSLFAVCKKHSHTQITRTIRMELSTKAGTRALGAQEMSIGDNHAMDEDEV